MFEIIFELSFVIYSFGVVLLSEALSFPFDKLSTVAPSYLVVDQVVQHPLSILDELSNLAFIVINNVSIYFCYHHPLILNSFIVSVVLSFMHGFFILNLYTIIYKCQTGQWFSYFNYAIDVYLEIIQDDD